MTVVQWSIFEIIFNITRTFAPGNNVDLFSSLKSVAIKISITESILIITEIFSSFLNVYLNTANSAWTHKQWRSFLFFCENKNIFYLQAVHHAFFLQSLQKFKAHSGAPGSLCFLHFDSSI